MATKSKTIQVCVCVIITEPLQISTTSIKFELIKGWLENNIMKQESSFLFPSS
jgi:hypothetical protein